MKSIPVLSRTFFYVYWNGIKQTETLSFTLNDAILEADKVFNNGISCKKNKVDILSSLGTRYSHLGDGKYQQNNICLVSK